MIMIPFMKSLHVKYLDRLDFRGYLLVLSE
jgi:hypothetical protein